MTRRRDTSREQLGGWHMVGYRQTCEHRLAAEVHAAVRGSATPRAYRGEWYPESRTPMYGEWGA